MKKLLLFAGIFFIAIKCFSQTAGSIGNNQTICSMGDPALLGETTPATGPSLTYQWQSSVNNVTFNDIAGATATTYDPPSGLASTTYYKRKDYSNATFIDFTNTVTVTINSVTAGSVTPNQTVCNGGDPNAFTSAAGSGTALAYQWTSSFDNTTYTDISGASGAVYDVPSGINRTTYFKRRAISTLNAVSCTSLTSVTTVTVITGGIVLGDAAICSGVAPTAFSVQVGPSGGVLGYQWQVSTNNVSFSNISGATSATYSPGAGIAQTTYFKRLATSIQNSVTCTNSSNTITIAVNSISAGTIGGDQVICNSGNPSAFSEVSPATGSSLSYQWQQSTNGTTYTNITGATGITYDVPAGVATTTYYIRKSTGTLSGTTCTSLSNAVTVTVNQVGAGTVGSSHAICTGGDPNAFTVITPATGSSLSYEWQSSTNNVTYNPISGATSADYDAPAGLGQTTYYRRIASGILSAVSCSSTGNILTVTLNPVTAGGITGNQRACYGGDPTTFTSTSLGSGAAISYQWQLSVDNVNFSNISGANFGTYNPPAGVIFTTYYRRLAIATISGTSCSAPTNAVTVTINEGGTVVANQTICSGGNPGVFTELTPATGSSISYQWQQSANGITFNNIPAANSTSYDPPAGVTANTYYRRIAYSVLAGLGVNCTAYSNTATVTINTVMPGILAGNQTICSGGDPNAFTNPVAAQGSALTYQWKSSFDNVTYNDISGANQSTYDIPSGLTRTTYCKRSTSSTMNAVTCSAESNVVTASVNSGGIVSGGNTICSGEAPAIFNSPVGASGTLSGYQWQVSTDNVNFTNVTGATTATYSPGGGITQNTWFRRIATSSLSGLVCVNASNVISITVLPVSAGTVAGTQTICKSGDPATFTETSSAAGPSLSYQWGKSTEGTIFGNINGATATTYDVPEGLTATTYYRRTATTAMNGKTCSAVSNILTVSVNLATAGTVGNSQAICTGGDPAAFTESSAAFGAALSYQWQNSTDNINFSDIVGQTGTGYDPPAGLTQTTYYKRRVNSTFNGVACTATGNVLSVSINSVTSGSIAGNQVICKGGDPVPFTSSVLGSGASIGYQWQASSDNVNFSNVNGQLFATYNVPAGVQSSTYYRRQATANLLGVACIAATNSVLVTVNDINPGTIGSNQSISNGGNPAPFTELTPVSGATSYTYQWLYSTNGSAYTNVIGANGITYDVPAGLNNTSSYFRLVTGTANGISCVIGGNVVVVTVAPTFDAEKVEAQVTQGRAVAPAFSPGKGLHNFSIYPNPLTARNTTVQLDNYEAGRYILRIINRAGQVVHTQQLQHNGGKATYPVRLSASLISGSYIIELLSLKGERNSKQMIINSK